MQSFNDWLKIREAYENSLSRFIGRDKKKPARVKPRRLTPEERKELHRERRPSDDPNWWQDNRPSNWNPEDED